MHFRDTLFIVFEADFRFYEIDCVQLNECLEMAVGGEGGGVQEGTASGAALSSCKVLAVWIGTTGGEGASRPSPSTAVMSDERPGNAKVASFRKVQQLP